MKRLRQSVTAAVAVAAVLFTACAACADGVPLHDGLISYWALNEGSGSMAFDTAPGGLVADHGVLRNSPAWIDGMFGAGLQFNGVDQSVLIPSSADMDIGTDAVTLSAWVKLDVMPSGIPQSFSGIFDSVPDSYVLYLDKGANELRFKVTTASGAAARPGVSASMLNTSDWHHVMGVYDSAGRASIYFNGELTDSLGSGSLVGPVLAGQTATIGADAGVPIGQASGTPRWFFEGGIADVAVWNRPLGLAEAQYLYAEGVGNAVGAANPVIEPLGPTPPNNRPVKVEAHRGNSLFAPENTLAAIIASAGYADLVEFDTHVTADGKLVLMHDATLNRTTNGSGSVSSRNYVGYIDGLDAGSWFSPSFAGEPVPTLAEAVETTLSLGMTPLIDRKTGSAAAHVNELNALGVLNDVVIIAFDWNFLSQVRELAPDVRLGALGSGSINSSVIANAISAGADYLAWNHSGVTQAAVELVHAAGLDMHVWTVNSMARMQELIDMGVDGITTDDPALLRLLVPWTEPPLAGDFNGDGLVDAADFTVWRDGLGSGTYTLHDYHDWKANFGGTTGAAAATQVAVPEPSGWMLAAVLGLALAAHGVSGRCRRKPVEGDGNQ